MLGKSGTMQVDSSAGRVAALWLAPLLLALLATGCAQQVELETAYGQRRGQAAASVNGTSVLAELFREAGGRPATIMRLSSNLNRYDVLVWAPDDFTLPSDEAREFIEKWLAQQSGRTFIYIGRDYDAATDYWQSMSDLVSADEQLEYWRRAARARAEHSQARVAMPSEGVCEWMVMRGDMPPRPVDQLSGPWARGINASATRLWTQGRIEMPTRRELRSIWKSKEPMAQQRPQYELLLSEQDTELAYEVTKDSWNDSRIVVVANGSFLLNLPLVNHEHRQLASRLVEHCQPFSRVAFLEVPGYLAIGDLDSVNVEMKRMRVLLAFHWLVLGVVFCFSVFPIFGRPKEGAPESVADFGQHVEAMAVLLERTGDLRYARQQIEQYRRGRAGERTATGSNPASPHPDHPGDRSAPTNPQGHS